jgi:8-oxo-dGTP pyrophosphatase MutT (NUDIX family)
MDYEQNNKYVPCAGFVVFSPDFKRTILVKTYAGRLSFPKGKRHKGETDMETALREMEEETGLSADDITLLANGSYIDELSNKGNATVRYFICRINEDKPRFIFDDHDLAEVKWYDCSKVKSIDSIKNTRKNVLKTALSMII